MELPTRLSKVVTIKGRFEDFRVMHRLCSMRGVSYTKFGHHTDFSYFNPDKRESCNGSILINERGYEIMLVFYPIRDELHLNSTQTIINRVLSAVKKPHVEVRYSHSDYRDGHGMMCHDPYFFNMWDMFNGGIGDVEANRIHASNHNQDG